MMTGTGIIRATDFWIVSDMKFALLCSGSKGNCFVLEDGALRLMIDCGSTRRYLLQSLEEVKMPVNSFDALLITHEHSDHTSQLRLMKDIPEIFAPYPLDGISNHIIRPLEPFQIHHMTVTPLALSHDAPCTVGFVFETPFEKLVYITDTGYVQQRYLPRMKGADYIILESNHDPSMLMHTNRPNFLKIRIGSDSGHLNNTQCGEILSEIVTEKTKSIFLAHISEQANTRELALQTNLDLLRETVSGKRNHGLWISAAAQFEILKGGTWHEEGDYGSCGCLVGLEHHSDRGTA